MPASAFGFVESRRSGYLNLGAAPGLIGTNARALARASPANGKFLGKTALVLNVSKIF